MQLIIQIVRFNVPWIVRILSLNWNDSVILEYRFLIFKGSSLSYRKEDNIEDQNSRHQQKESGCNEHPDAKLIPIKMARINSLSHWIPLPSGEHSQGWSQSFETNAIQSVWNVEAALGTSQRNINF